MAMQVHLLLELRVTTIRLLQLSRPQDWCYDLKGKHHSFTRSLLSNLTVRFPVLSVIEKSTIQQLLAQVTVHACTQRNRKFFKIINKNAESVKCNVST